MSKWNDAIKSADSFMNDENLGLLKMAEEVEKRYAANKKERNDIWDQRDEVLGRARTYWLRNKDNSEKSKEIDECKQVISRLQKLI